MPNFPMTNREERDQEQPYDRDIHYFAINLIFNLLFFL
jgi:hypothetical protein